MTLLLLLCITHTIFAIPNSPSQKSAMFEASLHTVQLLQERGARVHIEPLRERTQRGTYLLTFFIPEKEIILETPDRTLYRFSTGRRYGILNESAIHATIADVHDTLAIRYNLPDPNRRRSRRHQPPTIRIAYRAVEEVSEEIYCISSIPTVTSRKDEVANKITSSTSDIATSPAKKDSIAQQPPSPPQRAQVKQPRRNQSPEAEFPPKENESLNWFQLFITLLSLIAIVGATIVLLILLKVLLTFIFIFILRLIPIVITLVMIFMVGGCVVAILGAL